MAAGAEVEDLEDRVVLAVHRHQPRPGAPDLGGENGPAQTGIPLLARHHPPCRTAASVNVSPAAPTMAAMVQSAGRAAASTMAAAPPPPRCRCRPDGRAVRAGAVSSSTTAMGLHLDRLERRAGAALTRAVSASTAKGWPLRRDSAPARRASSARPSRWSQDRDARAQPPVSPPAGFRHREAHEGENDGRGQQAVHAVEESSMAGITSPASLVWKRRFTADPARRPPDPPVKSPP